MKKFTPNLTITMIEVTIKKDQSASNVTITVDRH